MHLSAWMRRWCVPLLFAGTAALAAGSDSKLIDAIKDQNPKLIASLLASHANVNQVLPDGSTALAWATYQDNTAIAERLLAAGAKVNTSDQYGETPLTLACANGNATLVGEFLKRGADANTTRAHGETALMIAAAAGNPVVIHLLVEHGAKVNAVEQAKGQNALMWAAAERRPEAVSALLQAGADPNSASASGFTPLIFAAEKGDTECAVALLAAGADVNHALAAKSNALLISLTAKKFKVADLLISHGADLASRDRLGNTPLHVAAAVGGLESVNLLLSKGADLNARTAHSAPRGAGGNAAGLFFRLPPGEQTPLMLAASSDHVEVMRALVTAGADAKLKAQDGTTLVMAAAASGHLDAVEYAYELAPDVDSLTSSKRGVMHAAVTGTVQVSTEAEICKVIEFLAGKGAKVDAVDERGRTPIMIANAVPMDKVAGLLTKLTSTGGTVTHAMADSKATLR